MTRRSETGAAAGACTDQSARCSQVCSLVKGGWVGPNSFGAMFLKLDSTKQGTRVQLRSPGHSRAEFGALCYVSAPFLQD